MTYIAYEYLEPIPNQAINFIGNTENECFTGETYCTLVEAGDDIQTQFKLVSGGELQCNGEFDQTEDDYITGDDSDFSGGGLNWVLSGSEVSIDSETLFFVEGPATYNNEAVLNIGGLVDGFYYLTFEMSDADPDNPCDLEIILAGGSIETINPYNGTYSMYVGVNTAGGSDLIFQTSLVSGDTTGFRIDNVRLYRVILDCWTEDTNEVDESGNWLVGSGKLCKVNGVSSTILNDNQVENNTWTKARLTVTNRTQGTVTVMCGGNTILSISDNGTFTDYGYSGASGLIEIYTDVDFDGCIDDLVVEQYCTDFTFQIQDFETEEALGEVSAFGIQPVQDRLVFTFSPDSITYYGSETFLDYGCYRICVIQTCDDNDNLFVNGNWDSDLGGWTFVPSGTAVTSWDNGKLRVDFTGAAAISVKQIIPVTLGYAYCESHTVTLSDHTLVSVLQTKNLTCVTSHTPVAGVNFIENYCLNSSLGSASIELNITVTNSCTIWVDFSKFRQCVPPAEVMFCSGCISYKADHECTKVIEATGVNEQFGLLFDGYTLKQRIRAALINPRYAQEGEQYTYSNGVSIIPSVKSDKIWTMLLDRADETVHDTMRVQLFLDELYIDQVLYVPESVTDYTPEWDSRGKYLVAQSRFDVKQTSIYKR